MTIVITLVALADVLHKDGDDLTPVVDTSSLDLGNVCTRSTTTKLILHAVSRNGNCPSQNVFLKSTQMTISVGSVMGEGLSATDGGNITLPSNWNSVANNTLSNPVTSSVTFVAGALGKFSGEVNYDAVGARITDGTLTRSNTLEVTANVVNCDTTPPTLNLPDDMTVEATSPAGTAATFTATADDANPATRR